MYKDTNSPKFAECKKQKTAFQHLLGYFFFFFFCWWKNIWCNFSLFHSLFPARASFWVISSPWFHISFYKCGAVADCFPSCQNVMPMRDRTNAATSVIRLSKNQISYCWDSLNPRGVTVKYAGYFCCCCFLYVIQCEYLRSALYKSVLPVITTISRTVLMWLNRRRRLLCGKGWTHLHRCDSINVLKLSNTFDTLVNISLFFILHPNKHSTYEVFTLSLLSIIILIVICRRTRVPVSCILSYVC